MTHHGGHKRTQTEFWRTARLPCLSQGRSLRLRKKSKNVIHGGSKEKTTADQKGNKGLSHMSKTFGEIYCGVTRHIEPFRRFASHYIWDKTIILFQKQYIMSTVKHGGASVMVAFMRQDLDNLL